MPSVRLLSVRALARTIASSALLSSIRMILDLSRPRTDDFVLVELLLGVGRSVKVKKKIAADIIETLSSKGLDGEHVMIVFQDVPWENWSPGGGRVPHA